MGLFDFLKPKSNNRQFVSESAFINNRDKQMQMTPQTLGQLRKLNVTADKELKLEYFFYTNTMSQPSLPQGTRRMNETLNTIFLLKSISIITNRKRPWIPS